ncbi:unnamed protein product [Trichogramma brassicae]|uniref:Uncharacterized protein n=1 Tax=Trichogramma brassicae TaxID=86971 RepID=A0A6H5J105_9HYME|nr:unnamed protein product [Trichogramma brassicae]
MACFSGARKYTRRGDRGKKAPCLSDSDDDDDKGRSAKRKADSSRESNSYFLKQNVRRFPSDKRSKIQQGTFSFIPENRRVPRIMLEKKSDHKLSSKSMYMHRRTRKRLRSRDWNTRQVFHVHAHFTAAHLFSRTVQRLIQRRKLPVKSRTKICPLACATATGCPSCLSAWNIIYSLSVDWPSVNPFRDPCGRKRKERMKVCTDEKMFGTETRGKVYMCTTQTQARNSRRVSRIRAQELDNIQGSDCPYLLRKRTGMFKINKSHALEAHSILEIRRACNKLVLGRASSYAIPSAIYYSARCYIAPMWLWYTVLARDCRSNFAWPIHMHSRKLKRPTNEY